MEGTVVHDRFWGWLDAVPHAAWHTFTWLGDSALLLPGATFIALWLGIPARTRMGALWWGLCVGTVGALAAASKLAFLGWCIGSVHLNFTGFSGHTALAACVWPVMLWLLGARYRRDVRLLLAGLGTCLALGIGLSRLAIHVHSVAEVLAGLALGMAGSAVFLWLQRGSPLPVLRARWLALGLLPVGLLGFGKPAPTQDLLEIVAARSAQIGQPCTREGLRSPR